MEILFIVIVVIFIAMGRGGSNKPKKQVGAPDSADEAAKTTGSMAALYRNQSSRSRGGASAAREEGADINSGGAAYRANPQSYVISNTARLAEMKRRKDAAAMALEREAAEAAIARRQETDYRSGSVGQKPLAQDLNRQRRRGIQSGRHQSKLSGQLVFIIVVLGLLTLISVSKI